VDISMVRFLGIIPCKNLLEIGVDFKGVGKYFLQEGLTTREGAGD
jgi:hypothetical protein